MIRMGALAKHYYKLPEVYLLEKTLHMLELEPTYPKNPRTIGEIIRKVRMDKGLQIKQVAQAVKVSPDSVINWELRGRKPRYRHIAMLEKILGINLPVSLLYKGYPENAITISQKIKKKRLELSLSQKELARMLKVNKDTIKDWEDGKGMKKPVASSLKKIRWFLGVNR